MVSSTWSSRDIEKEYVFEVIHLTVKRRPNHLTATKNKCLVYLVSLHINEDLLLLILRATLCALAAQTHHKDVNVCFVFSSSFFSCSRVPPHHPCWDQTALLFFALLPSSFVPNISDIPPVVQRSPLLTVLLKYMHAVTQPCQPKLTGFLLCSNTQSTLSVAPSCALTPLPSPSLFLKMYVPHSGRTVHTFGLLNVTSRL